MPDLDGAEGSCYNGENLQLWAKHVQALNNLHSSVYPCVLEKGVNENWTKVHQNYPELEGFNPEELQPGYEAMDFLLTEMDKIDSSKANRDEANAIDVFKYTKQFMDIMKSRVKTRDIYNKIIPECAEMQTKEYNNSVLLLKIQHQRANGDRKAELEMKIIARSTDYEEYRNKMEETLTKFKESSKSLAQQEGLTFNEKFNRNQYLNYWQVVKHFTINNRKIKSYWEEQESCWNDCLSYLDNGSKNLTNVEKLPQTLDPNKSKEMLEKSRKKEKQESFKHKLKMFRDSHKEAEDSLSNGTLEELQASLKEITEVQRQLKELTYDPEIEVSDDWKKFIRDQKLPRDLTQRINNIQTQRANESERKKQEFIVVVQLSTIIGFYLLLNASVNT